MELKRSITDKDDYVDKHKVMLQLQLTQERSKNLVQEELRLKELLTQKDAINCKSKDEIVTLKEFLQEKERKNNIQEKECKRLKDSVSILIADDLKVKAENNENEELIWKLQKELLTQSIQLWSIQQQMVSSRDILAQTITQMTIKSAHGVLQAEELL